MPYAKNLDYLAGLNGTAYKESYSFLIGVAMDENRCPRAANV